MVIIIIQGHNHLSEKNPSLLYGKIEIDIYCVKKLLGYE